MPTPTQDITPPTRTMDLELAAGESIKTSRDDSTDTFTQCTSCFIYLILLAIIPLHSGRRTEMRLSRPSVTRLVHMMPSISLIAIHMNIFGHGISKFLVASARIIRSVIVHLQNRYLRRDSCLVTIFSTVHEDVPSVATACVCLDVKILDHQYSQEASEVHRQLSQQ